MKGTYTRTETGVTVRLACTEADDIQVYAYGRINDDEPSVRIAPAIQQEESQLVATFTLPKGKRPVLFIDGNDGIDAAFSVEADHVRSLYPSGVTLEPEKEEN